MITTYGNNCAYKNGGSVIPFRVQISYRRITLCTIHNGNFQKVMENSTLFMSSICTVDTQYSESGKKFTISNFFTLS